MTNINIPDALLFIDTNILLDFYRFKNTDIGIKYLELLEACKDRLILGAQVEMEYKKNRQTVILESYSNVKNYDFPRLIVPAIVSELQAVKMIEKKKKEIIIQKDIIINKIQKILADPTHHDPVYQHLQRLFKHESPYNLVRPMKERFVIRSLARKRFFLGYPPRKKGDTSIGDALNWEWIVHCAKQSGKHIVIVTRDTDYGIILNGQSYLNDYLRQEFSQRVSQQRKIILTNKLSVGLKTVHAAVTKEMVKEEARIMAELANDFDDLSQLDN
jgi:hypothetical protein